MPVQVPVQVPKLQLLAAAAVMNLPWAQRRAAIAAFGESNPWLRDTILAANKRGYAPIVQWLQAVSLDTEADGEEPDDVDNVAGGEQAAKRDDGEVTLSTIHACKGMQCFR